MQKKPISGEVDIVSIWTTELIRGQPLITEVVGEELLISLMRLLILMKISINVYLVEESRITWNEI